MLSLCRGRHTMSLFLEVGCEALGRIWIALDTTTRQRMALHVGDDR
jgi:hypothetical protein